MAVKKYKILNVANTETGEVSTLITEVNAYKNSKKTFTKVYHDRTDKNYEVIKTLTSAEQSIYLFIIYNLKMYSKSIVLHHSLFNFGKQKYYLAIKGLTIKSIISKAPNITTGTNENNKYLINTDFLFNGKI